MKTKLLIALGAFLVLFSVFAFSRGLLITNQPSLSGEIPDTPEAKEIMLTIERAYDIEAEAKYNLDTSKLSNVFISFFLFLQM